MLAKLFIRLNLNKIFKQMKHKKITLKYLLIAVISIFVFAHLQAQDKKTIRLIKKVEKRLNKGENIFERWSALGEIKLDSIYLNRKTKTIKLFYNKELSYLPFREELINELTATIKKKLKRKFRKYKILLYSNDHNITDFVPNIYRINIPVDSNRFTVPINKKTPIISRFYPLKPTLGLLNRNLAIWHSHGKYYEAKLDRWEWQRARLHSTVEDIFPMTFVLDYIEPMLENAGANVFIPRERDINTNEIIIDNDRSTGKSIIHISDMKIDTISKGFFNKDTLYNNDNPFLLGTSLKLTPIKNHKSSIKYIADIPANGYYAVYISYGNSDNEKVEYTIHYAGGNKKYIVNQTQGQNTWLYLGKFYFTKGINASKGSIEITSKTAFSTDAIKIGGGMGNIARRPPKEIAPNAWSLKGGKLDFQKDKNKKDINPDDYSWKISELPRYLEAARYYLQYSGMPDSIVYSLSRGKNDYNDDYKCRGEWVNYLMGKPNGPTGHNDVQGLGIPIDMALAFHTDAGVTPDDSIIGTLAIYSSDTPDTSFPSGQSKMVNRDLVDIIQTQIVSDIRKSHNPDWTRRGIWDKAYSEAWRANTPMMLLELMSHQNLADISYGLDHRFKFTVARAIYKGILKFLAYQNNTDYVVQPLPVSDFAIDILNDKKIILSWKATQDPIEASAAPKAFIVYQKEENMGFDQGKMTRDSFMIIELKDYNKLYSFKVTAINKGGESFPSETLSTGIIHDKPVALVVNAFTRISAPAKIDTAGLGFLSYNHDMGVPYKHEIGLTGMPYEWNRNIPWIDDDNPGWGASYADWENKVIAGNSFDYPAIHGKAIMHAGYSFVSCSEKAFVSNSIDANKYFFTDIIFGEQRTVNTFNKKLFTVFTPEMMNKIKAIASNKGNIFLSGAYIGSDCMDTGDTIAQNFIEKTLHYKWRTNFASKSGKIKATDYMKKYFNGSYQFNTKINDKIYMVEAPDGIEPADQNCVTIFRYNDTGVSAAIAYKKENGIVVLGFPFETILKEKQRDDLIKHIIDLFLY